MITAFNALLECFFTALCVAAMLLGMAKIGWFPILYMSMEEPPEEEDN